MTQELHTREKNHALTEDEISRYKTLQHQIGSHTISRELAVVQQALIDELKTCNTEMSQVMGFDFASTALPVSSCC